MDGWFRNITTRHDIASSAPGYFYVYLMKGGQGELGITDLIARFSPTALHPDGYLNDRVSVYFQKGDLFINRLELDLSAPAGRKNLCYEYATVDKSTIMGNSKFTPSVPASGGTFFLGLQTPANFSNKESAVQIPVTFNCTADLMHVLTGSTQGAVGNFQVILRVDGADSALNATIPAGGFAGAYADLSNTVSITASGASPKFINIKLLNNNSAVSSIYRTLALRLKASDGKMRQMLAANQQIDNAAATTEVHIPLFCGPMGTADNTLPAGEVVMPRPGVFRNLFAYGYSNAGANSADVTLYKNGVATALTVAVDQAAAGMNFNNDPDNSHWHSDTTNSVTVEKGDRVTLKWERASASQDDNLWMIAVEFSEE